MRPIDQTTRQQGTRRIVIVAAPGAQLLDVAGPFDVFSGASKMFVRTHPGSPPPYEVDLISTSADVLVRTTSGLELTAAGSYSALTGPIDTLLVAGGAGARFREAWHDRDLVQWLRRAGAEVRRLGSICTGAFFLAEAGLLDSRRATTHWEYCRELARTYPAIRVDPEPIFVCDRGVYSSAGVTAGMDLALALVEEDVGPRIAHGVAKELVLYMRRPGGQSQLSATMALQIADRRSIRELEAWIAEHLADDLSVRTLAVRVAMSPRHFARVFAGETGATPARYVERIRIEAARRRLEESDDTVDQIAAQCGFRSADSMRRVFRRVAKITPTAFRQRFAQGRYR